MKEMFINDQSESENEEDVIDEQSISPGINEYGDGSLNERDESSSFDKKNNYGSVTTNNN